MNASDLVDRLATLKTMGGVPRDELAWLAAHGTVRQLDPGKVLSSPGARVDDLYILLAGHLVIFVDRGAGRNKILEWRTGDVTGLLPYSRLVSPPGEVTAVEPTVVLAIHRDLHLELVRNCHTITSMLVHNMVDRARTFTSSGLHDEKMVSLGKLSAGLAHELNNPASAIERSAVLLERQVEQAERAARALGSARLTHEQLAAVEALRASCLATTVHGVASPIEQAEREQALADWLDVHGVDGSLADALAETAVTIGALDQVAAAVQGEALAAVLRWAAAGCSLRSLAGEIREAAMRISALVIAIKGFTHMDQAPVAEPVDVSLGLGSTVAVLRSKARSKAVSVVVDIAPGLPPVLGFAGELNQIWANLIDNALDAVPASGQVEVRARREGAHVEVRVIDNGSGIPDEIRSRIFDPFFTTKPMGQGTGMGLDIARRLVLHNGGDIAVESRPGRTEFRVWLPVEGDGGGPA